MRRHKAATAAVLAGAAVGALAMLISGAFAAGTNGGTWHLAPGVNLNVTCPNALSNTNVAANSETVNCGSATTPTTTIPNTTLAPTTTTATPTTTTVAPTTTNQAPTTTTVPTTTTTTAPGGGTPPFATSVSANGRYLVDQNGNPFLINGDSGWDVATKLDAADQATYLADRAAAGFNTVLTDLVGSPGVMQGNNGGANYAGDLPFTDSNFTPNPAYWAKIDTFFQEAAQHGITVMAIPIDAYATGSVFASITNTQAPAFGTFLAQRYPQSQYPGIIWTLGNDYAGDGVGCCNGGFTSQYQALLTGLAAGGSTRPTTIEEGFYESLSSDGASVGPKVTLNWAYNYHPTYTDILRGYAAKDEPVLFGEGAYENATTGFPSAPVDLRKQLGWSMTSGAAGTLYGNDRLWMFASGWQNQLDTVGVAQRKVFNAAIAGTKWWTLQPDTGSRLVTAGRNIQGSNFSIGSNTPFTNDSTYGNYVTAAYSPDGTLGLVYNPDSTKNSITLSPSVLAANPQIVKVDPTNGARTNLGWTTNPAGGTNAGGDHDWLYVITAG